MPTAPGLLRDERWPHCSEQNSPIYVWYCIRAVNIEVSVLGHISPHLKPLVSVVVGILGQSHLSRGLMVFLNSQAFSHRLLETNTQLSVTSMGRVPKWAAPSLAPRHRLCLPHAVALSGVATGKSWLSSQSRDFESCLFKEGIVAGWKSSTCFTSSNYGFERNRTRLLGCGCCSRKLRPSQRAEVAACAPLQHLRGVWKRVTLRLLCRDVQPVTKTSPGRAARWLWAHHCHPKGLRRSEVVERSLRTRRTRDHRSRSSGVLVRGFLCVTLIFCTISKHGG